MKEEVTGRLVIMITIIMHQVVIASILLTPQLVGKLMRWQIWIPIFYIPWSKYT